MENKRNSDSFCRTYLQTMDPDRAAAEIGHQNGYGLLASKAMQDRLEKMRCGAASQLRREDVLRRLAQLAFGGANDAVYLALHAGEADPKTLDLSAVAEFKVTDKGGVEIKLADRVRALETLCGLLENGGSSGTEDLYRVLAESVREEEWDHG